MMQFLMGIFVLAFSLSASCLTITKAADLKTVTAPAENFTGKVTVTPFTQTQNQEHSRISCAKVEFSPSARTYWHTHPMGQTLIVTKGEGRIQAFGEPVRVIKEGDVIWTPPGQKHWHGASPDQSMSHLAIQEIHEGKAVQWMEKVTDEAIQIKTKSNH